MAASPSIRFQVGLPGFERPCPPTGAALSRMLICSAFIHLTVQVKNKIILYFTMFMIHWTPSSNQLIFQWFCPSFC